MIKKISLIFVVFVTFFSINANSLAISINTVSIQNSINNVNSVSIPSNFQSFSREAKIEVLRNLITQIQSRIQNSSVVGIPTPVGKLPFGTRVILNSIDKINSDITEEGKFGFSIKENIDTEYMNGYFKTSLNNNEYKVSVEGDSKIDIHFAGEYSVDVSMNYRDFVYAEDNISELKKNFKVKIVKDYYSIDFIFSEGDVFIKIDGFERVMQEIVKFTISSMREESFLTEKEKDLIEAQIIEMSKLIKEVVIGQWIKIPRETVNSYGQMYRYMIAGGNIDIDEDTIIKILKEEYIKNDFILFKNDCGKFEKNSSVCVVDNKINFNKLQNFTEGVIVAIANEIGETITESEKKDIHKELSSFFTMLEKRLVLKMKLSINKDEDIVGSSSYVNFYINEKDFENYFGEEIGKDKADVNIRMFEKNKIKYTSDVREIKSFTSIEELMAIFMMKVQEFEAQNSQPVIPPTVLELPVD